MTFLASLDDEDLMYGFANEANSFISAKNEMIQLARQMQNKELEDALTEQFAKHTAFEQRFRQLFQLDQEAPSGPLLD